MIQPMKYLPHASRRHQKGLTLIEIMVSMTISLVIFIAIGMAYMNSNNLTIQREGQADLNDPARIVMRQLRQSVNMAGYVDIYDIRANTGVFQASALFSPGADEKLPNLYQRVVGGGAAAVSTPLEQFFTGLRPVFGCDGAMNGTPNAVAAAGSPAALTCGTVSATRHTLQLAYQAAPEAATTNLSSSLIAPNGATGEGNDCLQQNPVATTSKVVINRFYVQTDANDGVGQLMCAGSGNSVAQPIARGIEEFIVRYMVSAAGTPPAVVGATAPSAGTATAQYLYATNVALDAVGWPGVSAVEICFMSATPKPVITNGSQTKKAGAVAVNVLQPTRQTCQRDANGLYLANIARATGDERLWKRFTAVIAFRNTNFSTPY